MKTASKLFATHCDMKDLQEPHINGMSMNKFTEAITEHDNEIKKLIDEIDLIIIGLLDSYNLEWNGKLRLDLLKANNKLTELRDWIKTNEPGTEEEPTEDHSEVRILIGVQDKHIIMKFSEKKISWFGMTPDEAMNIGRILFQKADAIKFGN